MNWILFVTLFTALSPIVFAQAFNYDLDGHLTAAAYGGGTNVDYVYDPAANISLLSATSSSNTNFPVVTILSPSAGSTASSTILNFNGTVVDKNQVTLVYHQLNNNAWQTATTGNGWTNWNATATLVPGTNVLTVYAQDAACNTGTNRLSINCVPLWTPLQFGANLALWLDASSSGSITLNGTTVAQWNDLSGQGNNVANSDASTQPVYLPTGLNGLPTVNFITGGMGLSSANNFGVSGSAPRALAAVMNGGLVATGTPTTDEAFGFSITPGGNVWAPYLYNNDIYADNPSFSGNNNVVFGQYYNGILSGYFNGGLFGSNSVAPSTIPATVQLGTRSDGSEVPGEISEIVYVNMGLVPAVQQVLEGYLAWKWGLQTNLPANHPYRNAAPVIYGGIPVLTIVSPSPVTTTTNVLIAVSGTATGANPIASVFFQVGGNPQQPASTVNAWTNWNGYVPLSPGTNILTIYAQDVAANTVSKQITINYVSPSLWTPIQLGTNLTLWLDAANTNSVVLNGSNVSQWSDLSGQGNSVYNSIASTQPTYQPTGLNGLPTINFTTGGMSLLGVGNFGVLGSAPRAAAAVFYGGAVETGTPAAGESFGFTDVPGGYVWAPYLYASSGDIYAYDPSFSTDTNIFFGQYFNGILSGYFNGSFFGSNSIAPNTIPDQIQIGTRLDGFTQPGEISEIIYVDTGLTLAQQQILEGYLAWKWGLQTNLPTSHPYRYAPPLAAGLNVSITTGLASGKGVQIRMIGVPGCSYVLQSATNLAPPINWQPVWTNVAGTNGNWAFTNTSISTPRTRFFRVTGP